MIDYLKKLTLVVPTQHKGEFDRNKFNNNNLRILILAAFLVLEQAYYGFFIHQQRTALRRIHFFTALLMFLFVIISTYFIVHKPQKINIFHKIYEVSIGLSGLLIAIIRAIFSTHGVFRLPTIYIAVLYGMAVYFYYNYHQSFIMYLTVTVTLIFILPIFKPALEYSSYIADAISNGLIAWLVSMFNYYKYVQDFINNKIIQKKNKQLVEKNQRIKEINQQLEELIIKDDLTEIYNRRKLDEELERLCSKAQRYEQQFALILLDLDHFKLVNDNYGHNKGDKVLKDFSNLLVAQTRDVDICGRWGGEEFLVLCPETNLEAAVVLAERLRKSIDHHQFLAGTNLTSSLGVAAYNPNDNVESLLKRVDDCLYRAKEAGRNSVISTQEHN